jgi:hypothetical protein
VTLLPDQAVACRLRLAGAVAALVLFGTAVASAAAAEGGGAAPTRDASTGSAASPEGEAPPEGEGPLEGEDPPEGETSTVPEAPIEKQREATVIHGQEEDPENIGSPIFPQVQYRDAVRLRVQTHFVPLSDFGSADIGLYSPDLRLRVTVPLSERGVLQFTGRGGSSQYTFSGSTDWFGLGPTTSDPVEGLYSLVFALQGAYRLNDGGYLFRVGESWSVLAGGFGRSRWEGSDIADGWTGGATAGLGYQSRRLRIALGVAVESKLTGGGANVGPVASIRWDPTKRLTLRNRGTGAQIEYRLSKPLKVFATGYVAGQRYRLSERPGVPGNPTLRDQQVLAGVGFEWRPSRHFVLNLEGGVVASHEIKVQSDGVTLSSTTADPAGYFAVRIAVRP